MNRLFISVLINALIVILTFLTISYVILAMISGKKGHGQSPWTYFRYFTTDSNILAAAAGIAVSIGDLLMTSGRITELPGWICGLKMAGTAAVTVTFLTVILFLGPTQGGYKQFYVEEGFYLHIAGPLLAILSFLFLDPIPGGGIFMGIAGILPVVIYGLIYLRRVVLLRPGEEGWPDFYGFNRNGHWKASMTVMFLAGAVVSGVLWLVK